MDHSRRNFIKKSLTSMAGLTLATTVPQSLNAMSSRVSASDSLNVGLIGCKGMGFANLRDHLKVPGVKCVALCDVDKNILESRAA
ncbi:MAG: twin-arginine translocation signal domain-containing protein, partial [Bacteroidales bacterium]